MRIGDYEVQGELGRSPQSVVYRARSPKGRDVAVKLLLNVAPATLARFAREERLHASLGAESGFVPFVESGTCPEGPYLVMPFFPGGTLRDRIKKGPLPIEDVIDTGRRIAEALGRAHALGIVHRDVKPDNVLLDATGRPFLADLGLAKHFDKGAPGASESVALTHEESLLGTVLYMAPEQAMDARLVGPPADVFSLGAVLYECLTGVEAFKGKNVAEIVRKILGREGKVVPIPQLRRDAPPELVAVVERMLARDPKARFADGAAAGVALKALYRPARSRRTVGLLGALAGALLVLAAVAGREWARGPARPAGPETAPSGTRTTGAPPSAGVARVESASPVPPTSTPSRAPTGPYRAIAPTENTTLREVLGEPRAGHAGPVRSVAFGADGSTAFTLGDDGRLRSWELATGRPIDVLPGAVASGSIIAVSDDGARAVLRTPSRGVALVDVARREVGQTLDEEDVSSRGAHFTADRKHLVVRSRRGIDLVELASGKVHGAKGRGRGGAVASTADGQRIASVAEGEWVVVLDPVAGEEVQRLGRGGATVSALTFLRDGTRLASARDDGTLEVWSLATGKRLYSVGAARATVLASSADSSRIFAGGADGALRVYDSGEGALLSTIPIHLAAIRGLALSKDETSALTGSVDGTARLVDLIARTELRALGSPGAEIATLAVAPDGARLTAGLADGGVVSFDSGSGRVERRFEDAQSLHAARPVLSSDATHAFVGASGPPALLEVATGRVTPLPFRSSESVHGAGFSPDGKTLVVGSVLGILVFDAATGAPRPQRPELASAEAKLSIVLAVTPQSRIVVAHDSAVRIWDLEKGKSVAAVPSNSVTLPAVLSPEGARLLAVTRREVSTARATGGAPPPQSLALWDLPSGTRLRELKPETGGSLATSLSFAPDGWHALVTGSDGTLRLWNLATGDLLDAIDLGVADDRPGAAVFARDGRSFFVGTARGVVLRFELSSRR